MPSRIKYCACGCGVEVKRKFVSGHNLRLLDPSDPKAARKRSKTLKAKYRYDSVYRELIQARLNDRNTSLKMRKKVSERAKARWANPEFKARVSASMKGSKKNLKKWQRQGLSKYWKQYWEENPHPGFSVEAIRRFKAAARKKWDNPDFRRKMAAVKYRFECGTVKTKKGGAVYYRSSWEKLIDQLLDSSRLVKKFIPEPFGIPYKYRGERHKYYPDRLVELVDGRVVLLEVKGYSYENAGKVRAKHKAAGVFCQQRGYEFVVVTEKPIAPLTNYIQ